MDFSWTPEQEARYEQAVEFAVTRVNPLVEKRGDGLWGLDEWRLCGELGLLGLSLPTAFGGGGLGNVDTSRVVEGFSRGCDDTGLVFSACAHLFAVAMPIAEHAGDELKARVLPKLASGEWVGANAITEPEAGSDVFALKATAVREGDEYVLSGTKSFVTNAPLAHCFLVYASTNPGHGYLGITAFVVERDLAGVSVGEHFEKVGLTTTPVAVVDFDGCRVPAANRVGEEGRGAGIFTGSMGWERCCLFALYLGTMERQLEAVVRHARGRKQFGKSLAKYQAVSHAVAEMKLRLDAARLLLYRAAWLRDQGEDATMEIAMSKLAVSEAAVQSGLDAIQLFGGTGVRTDTGIERALRDAVPGRIFSGTSEIQRELIARGVGL